jgi:hypothetical protein
MIFRLIFYIIFKFYHPLILYIYKMAKKKTANQPKAQPTNAKNNLGQKINKVTNRRGRKNKNN